MVRTIFIILLATCLFAIELTERAAISVDERVTLHNPIWDINASIDGVAFDFLLKDLSSAGIISYEFGKSGNLIEKQRIEATKSVSSMISVRPNIKSFALFNGRLYYFQGNNFYTPANSFTASGTESFTMSNFIVKKPIYNTSGTIILNWLFLYLEGDIISRINVQDYTRKLSLKDEKINYFDYSEQLKRLFIIYDQGEFSEMVNIEQMFFIKNLLVTVKKDSLIHFEIPESDDLTYWTYPLYAVNDSNWVALMGGNQPLNEKQIGRLYVLDENRHIKRIINEVYIGYQELPTRPFSYQWRYKSNEIFFLSYDEKSFVQLYSIDVNNGAITQLTHSQSSLLRFRISPDGKKVLTLESGHQQKIHIYEIHN
jgi:hypothetical protein